MFSLTKRWVRVHQSCFFITFETAECKFSVKYDKAVSNNVRLLHWIDLGINILLEVNILFFKKIFLVTCQ